MTGSDLPELGRLRAVATHQVWVHEARDFTPWLLTNADVLGDVLGMDLRLSQAERPVTTATSDRS